MDSKKSDSIKSPAKAGYELLPPPNYEEALGEPVPEYDQDLEAQEPLEEPRPFSTGLFSCVANPMMILSTLCCTPCVFGATSRLLAEDPLNNEADLRNTNWWHVDTFLYSLLGQGGLECILGATRRGVVRSELNLEGSCVKDWAAHIFCGPCAVAQESMEVQRYRSRLQNQARNTERYRDEQSKLSQEHL